MTHQILVPKILATGAGILLLTAATSVKPNLSVNAMPLIDSPTLIGGRTPEEKTRIQLYQKASPAVVAIDLGQGHGSGFIVTPDGLVLTNAHVVDEAGESVKVILADGREVMADVLGFAGGNLDLAALKIRGQNQLPTLKLAPANSLQVGQTVYAIGTPVDPKYRNTLTEGIVSGIHDRGSLIQHDAPINHGHSGGPLLNSDGQVIGVNQMIATGAVVDDKGNVIGRSTGNIGISFAISTQVVRPFVTAVLAGKAPQVARQPRSPQERLSIAPLPMNGKAIADRLQPGDPTLPNNSYFHAYAFEGRAGQRVSIEVTSRQIDPSLILALPQAEKVIAFNDDISPQNFNARLAVILPADGIYVILTSAFAAGETGNYQIQAILK